MCVCACLCVFRPLLQRVAVCCSVLKCVAVCYSVFQYVKDTCVRVYIYGYIDI